MSFTVDYEGPMTGRTTPTPAVWRHFDAAAGLQRGDLFLFHDDFRTLNTTGLPWVMDESDDNASIALVADEELGFLRIALSTDDNEEAWIHGGSDGGTMAMIDKGSGDVAFGCRFRTSSIADNVNGIAFGLCEDGLAAGNDVFQANDTAALTQISVVGFQTLQADGDSLDIIHGENGSSVTQLVDGAATLVADTWTKAEFFFNSGTGKVKFFIDEVEQGTSVLESATNFPDNVGLVPFFAAKVGSAASLNFDIDWVRVAHKRVA